MTLKSLHLDPEVSSDTFFVVFFINNEGLVIIIVYIIVVYIYKIHRNNSINTKDNYITKCKFRYLGSIIVYSISQK